MKAKLIAVTKPVEDMKEYMEDAGDLIAFCARVSNPDNQGNKDTAGKLLNYLKRYKHWSPFEMANCVVEVEAPRDIARQLLRHRSFAFQEFCIAGDSLVTMVNSSGSYKKPIEELYKRYTNKHLWNRSNNCVRVFDEETGTFSSAKIKEVFKTGEKEVFKLTLSNGKSIKSTKEHKFLTMHGFKTMGELGTGDFVGCNGVPVHQSFEWLAKAKQESIDSKGGLGYIAAVAGTTTHTIRKWLKKHKLQYSRKEIAAYTDAWNKGLPKEQQPKYKKFTSEETREKQRNASRKGEQSNLYRGGKERSWRKEVADFWYKRKNVLFAEQGGRCAITNEELDFNDAEIDHLLPVSQRPDLAFDRSNVRIIGSKAHTEKSVKESLHSRIAPCYHKVVSIESCGVEQTYDIEVDHVSHNYVANGICTHNSQRYAEAQEFVVRETRMQDTKNRQNSLDCSDKELKEIWEEKQRMLIRKVNDDYRWALENGIAKECARVILPEGLTMSRLYVNGTIRSWIHYLEVRMEEGVTQKEHVELATLICKQINKVFEVVEIKQ